MLVCLIVAPIEVAQFTSDSFYRNDKPINPDDRTLPVNPFDIVAIVPVEFHPRIHRQCPQAASVVITKTTMLLNSTYLPVLGNSSMLNEVWNRALREYAAAAPKEVAAVRQKAGLDAA